MAGAFTMEIEAITQALAKSVEATAVGLHNGLNDVKNDWIVESEQISPLQDGHLREAIDGSVKGLEVEVGVKAADLQHTSGKSFNYAAYIHDYDGKAVTGEKKFLDVAATRNQSDWKRMLDSALESELRKAGW